MPARQVVGYGVLLVGHVRHPVVGADVGDVEQVEAVHAQPHVAQVADELPLVAAVLVVQQAVAHADVHALVGRGAEGHPFQSRVGRAERQAVGHAGLECHLPARGAGEEVAEEEVQVVTLVRGLREAAPVHLLLRLHQAEADPRVRPFHELAEELEVDARGVARADVAAVVDDLHVVHVVGDEVAPRCRG